MEKLSERVEFVSGSPQFRITEDGDEQSPLYIFYSQTDLAADLTGVLSSNTENKRIRTQDEVNTLRRGDVVFSLISGSAAIAGKEHDGYLYTQNYIKLLPDESLDAKFLVYLLNENRSFRRQLQQSLQGSSVMKYTLKQINELKIPLLPSLDKQTIIGSIYLKQQRLQALKKRAADLETVILLKRLEEGVEK